MDREEIIFKNMSNLKLLYTQLMSYKKNPTKLGDEGGCEKNNSFEDSNLENFSESLNSSIWSEYKDELDLMGISYSDRKVLRLEDFEEAIKSSYKKLWSEFSGLMEEIHN